MKKIYEASGETKRNLVEDDNDYRSHLRQCFYSNEIGIKDLIMVGRTNSIPINNQINIKWSLNGLLNNDDTEKEDIIVIEPLSEQIDNGKILNLNESNTKFDGNIELSDEAIILMPIKKYDELSKDSELKGAMENMNIRLYEGEEDLAVEMVFSDRNYIYIGVEEDGYIIDKKNHPDLIEYEKVLSGKINEINYELQKNGKIEYISKKIKNIKGYKKNSDNQNYTMISGLTKKIEGSIKLGEELYATTDIGKIRRNQEDAVLLIKDEENPKFKMIVVADGMGGWKNGEIASDVTVNELKDWFEKLSKEEKNQYYNNVQELKEILQKKIEIDIQIRVENETGQLGGTTLVCAIVGKNDTLIVNIGDSRAYIIKDGRLKQLSREDTVAQKNLENGKRPNKEASRFDSESNQLLQAIGMDRRELKHPHFEIINNMDYDMIVLFSDGVTDCLSDEDIAVVCRNSDRKEFAKKIVEKAIRHDSILPEEFEDLMDLNFYIPGGKDNATAAVYAPEKE